MSLQALFSLALSHPAQTINALAMFFAVAGRRQTAEGAE